MEVAERLYAIRRSALARGDMGLAGEVEHALISMGLPFHDDAPEVAVPPALEAAVPPKPRRGRPPKVRPE